MLPILPILFFITPTCLAFYLTYRNWEGLENFCDDKFDWVISFVLIILVTLLGTLIGTGIGVGISSVISDHSEQIWVRSSQTKLISLRSTDGTEGKISGGIFMLSGYINSEQIYYYYTLNDDGSFRPNKWRPDRNTNIYEEDRRDGELIVWRCQFKHSWVRWLADPWDQERGDFHIPRGSLKQNFSLQ